MFYRKDELVTKFEEDNPQFENKEAEEEVIKFMMDGEMVNECIALERRKKDPVLLRKQAEENVPIPTVRRARKRMIAGMRMSGKHGPLVDNPLQVEGAAKMRKVKERLCGCVLESSGNNKYLVRFDNNLEKACASGTLRIESQSAAIPPNEVPDAPAPDDATIDACDTPLACDPDDASSSEEEDPMVDFLNDQTVNIGAINESADPPVEESMDVDIQDERPETHKDRLRTHRARIATMIGEKVEKVAGPKRNPHSRVTWEVIENHVAPVEPEVDKVRAIHTKSIGHKAIEELLQEENFQDPVSASGDVTSNSQTPLRPTDVSKSTVFAKMWLNLAFVNWRVSMEDLNRCVDKHNITAVKKMKLFSTSEFLCAHSIIIAAAACSMNGSRLWNNNGEGKNKEWETMLQPPGFDKHMKLYRFKQFRQLIPRIFEKEDLKDSDPWWQFKGAIDSFNQIRKVLCHLLLHYMFTIIQCTLIIFPLSP